MGKAIKSLASTMRRYGKNAAPTGPSTGPAHGASPKNVARDMNHPPKGMKGKSV